jgi:hypothetical protein
MSDPGVASVGDPSPDLKLYGADILQRKRVEKGKIKGKGLR